MDPVAKRKRYIEKTFQSLETFWETDVPEAIEHEGWTDFDLLCFVEEARGVPFTQYDLLLRELGPDLKAEYAERLAKLDALIAQNEPGLKELLKTG